MKTKTEEVKTFVTRLYCDCGEEMSISQQWADSQMRYIYKCSKCYFRSGTMTDKYPKIEYRTIPLIGQLAK